ncbi:MAG: winged helix-turn-helix domain-containing protein [Plesiomonas sp.]|uniref:winged helix-turn-helix domain-containing protein n=1 Tax=Plesiomonas sp. TaxID=2486279 RepID=UPI003F33F3D2
MTNTYQIRNIIISSDKTLLLDTESNREFKIGKHDYMTLLELARNAGHVLSKEHLLEKCWPGKIVAESSITQAISNIRSLIGDNGKEQKWLKTISKTGYRLESDVVTPLYLDMKKTIPFHEIALKYSAANGIPSSTQNTQNDNNIAVDIPMYATQSSIKSQAHHDKYKTTLLQLLFSLLVVFVLFIITIHYNSTIQKKQNRTLPEIYSDNILMISSDKPNLTSDLRRIIQDKIKITKQKPSSISILMMDNHLSFFIVENDELIHNQRVFINERSKKEDINKIIKEIINKVLI